MCALWPGSAGPKQQGISTMAKTAARKGKTAARKAPARKAATADKPHRQRRLEKAIHALVAKAAPRKDAQATNRTPVAGKARTIILDLAARKAGATSAELYTATGWKFASWSHQLKLITKATGRGHRIEKVDGTTRYFVDA
jgi:hypothetical protein